MRVGGHAVPGGLFGRGAFSGCDRRLPSPTPLPFPFPLFLPRPLPLPLPFPSPIPSSLPFPLARDGVCHVRTRRSYKRVEVTDMSVSCLGARCDSCENGAGAPCVARVVAAAAAAEGAGAEQEEVEGATAAAVHEGVAQWTRPLARAELALAQAVCSPRPQADRYFLVGKR